MNLKPRISNEWTISSVKDILSNPTYIGKIVWNRRKQKKKTKNGHIIISRPRNPEYLIYDGLHEPIIDNKTWELAQEKRKQNTPKVKHSNIVQNPLVRLNLLLQKNTEVQNKKETMMPNLENIINLYYKLETAEDKNILLKSIIAKVTYLKTEKAIKKDADPTNFELHIYPKISKM